MIYTSDPPTTFIVIIAIVAAFVFIGIFTIICKGCTNTDRCTTNNANNIPININQSVIIPMDLNQNVPAPPYQHREHINGVGNINNIRDNINTETNNLRKGFEVTNNNNGNVLKIENNGIYCLKESILQRDISPRDKICYFEIEIIDFNPSVTILLGYSSKCHDDISDNSILFSSGDIIGVFYNLNTFEMIFTYNGEAIYTIYYDSMDLLLPTIYSSKESLFRYNIGESGFLYQKANLLNIGIDVTSELPPSYILRN
ncbi:hypothetical protein K502DRAFT_361828 [Neoconidiobolus thromboides FSU 785]|nr:hypothetical protein K502DRAFT_361828 [Neoconidiobolus thromboides FSU 785]